MRWGRRRAPRMRRTPIPTPVSTPLLCSAYGRTTQMMIKANELERTTDDYVTLMSRYTGYPKAFMRKIVGRNRWLSAEDGEGGERGGGVRK